jgi:glycerol-1-phosphate dehydrogenase [NAD(P)+]
MGEHQISHWIDSFAGDRHPGTVHGQQVGIASVTMARLQEKILAMEDAPQIRPTVFDAAAIRARYPSAAVEACVAATAAKVMDRAAHSASTPTSPRNGRNCAQR